MSGPVRVVCAWCGAELAPGADPPSHGICDPCAAAFRAELVYSAAELVDTDPVAEADAILVELAGPGVR